MEQMTVKPEILAPAGDRDSFLAAVSAGAEAVYCGLKHFSARMEAENFSVTELAGLADVARSKGTKLYLAMNSLVKPDEPAQAGRLLDRIARRVRPEALIVQDLAMIELARQTGFSGALHLSTLANVSQPAALAPVRKKFGLERVVLPRELSIDEIKAMSQARPEGLELECFVHGALCYAVSGRCYWSSYLGGKSGLRGRCVQPCRRLYKPAGGPEKRHFSCLDLSLDILAKTLLDVPGLAGWKIEGRKKGPHYVFYTVKAYQLLREQPDDPSAKKTAQELLERALGRPSSHFFFLPQRPHTPIRTDLDQGSGLFVGRTSRSKGGRPQLKPRQELLPKDRLRFGTQDQPGHFVYTVSKYLPKGSLVTLPKAAEKTPQGTPAFLVDRREPELQSRISALAGELERFRQTKPAGSSFTPELPRPLAKAIKTRHMHVFSGRLPHGKRSGLTGLWLSRASLDGPSKTVLPKLWFWLPPVIWPDEERTWRNLLDMAIGRGARQFVLGAPWQIGLFSRTDRLELWAGPFCNLANPLAMQELAKAGLTGAFISPELSRQDLLALPAAAPLPLGMVLKGLWPLCVSRITPPELKTGQSLHSPKKEGSWLLKSGQTIYHYPAWPIDLEEKTEELQSAGYAVLAHLHTARPKTVARAKRTSSFNWGLSLS
jgi:putative protease